MENASLLLGAQRLLKNIGIDSLGINWRTKETFISYLCRLQKQIPYCKSFQRVYVSFYALSNSPLEADDSVLTSIEAIAGDIDGHTWWTQTSWGHVWQHGLLEELVLLEQVGASKMMQNAL